MAASNESRSKVLVDVVEAGRKGGLQRAAKMTAKQRKAAATKAIEARWKKWREENPEKAASGRTARAKAKKSAGKGGSA